MLVVWSEQRQVPDGHASIQALRFCRDWRGFSARLPSLTESYTWRDVFHVSVMTLPGSHRVWILRMPGNTTWLAHDVHIILNDVGGPSGTSGGVAPDEMCSTGYHQHSLVRSDSVSPQGATILPGLVGSSAWWRPWQESLTWPFTVSHVSVHWSWLRQGGHHVWILWMPGNTIWHADGVQWTPSACHWQSVGPFLTNYVRQGRASPYYPGMCRIPHPLDSEKFKFWAQVLVFVRSIQQAPWFIVLTHLSHLTRCVPLAITSIH